MDCGQLLSQGSRVKISKKQLFLRISLSWMMRNKEYKQESRHWRVKKWPDAILYDYWHENHSGSAMGSNCTEGTVKREDRCSKENKYNYSGNAMPIHGNAQKLTKTSNVSSLSKSGKKVLHSKRCLTLYLQGMKFLNMTAFRWEVLRLHLLIYIFFV